MLESIDKKLIDLKIEYKFNIKAAQFLIYFESQIYNKPLIAA